MHFSSVNLKLLIQLPTYTLRKRLGKMESAIVFKMIILGQQSVGKSSMLIRYIKGQFSEQYNVTVGVEFASKDIIVDQNKNVCMQIWDTAGQEAFRAIVRSFYKGISGVFLAFALDNQETLEALKIWHKEVRENGHEEVVFFLVGTRADLTKQREVSVQRAQQMLHQLGALFFIQTSAKTGLNIEQVLVVTNQLFQRAAEVMYKKYMISNVYREISSPTRIKRGHSLVPASSVKMEQSKKCCSRG